MADKVNLHDAFASFTETWSPRIAADIDQFQVKLAKLEGEFLWHHHPDADELFLVVRGSLQLRFRDRDDVWLNDGELFVVPRGVEYLPVAPAECHVLLLERAGVTNTLARVVRRFAPAANRLAGALLVLSGVYLAAYWLPALGSGSPNSQGEVATRTARISAALADFFADHTTIFVAALGSMLALGAALAIHRHLGHCAISRADRRST